MKKYVGIGLAVLVLAVLAAGLWYSRPLTIEELCPGIHLDAYTAVSFDYSTFEMQDMVDCTQNLRLEGEDLPPRWSSFGDGNSAGRPSSGLPRAEKRTCGGKGTSAGICPWPLRTFLSREAPGPASCSVLTISVGS